MKLIRLTLATLLSCSAIVLTHANTVTVQDMGMGTAYSDVYITSSTLGSNLHVYAGFIKLNVNGQLTQGLCVDPWHWSTSTAQTYNLTDLANAPTFPGAMGATQATKIEQLWAHFYSSSVNDNTNAAALQVVTWQLVDAGVSGGTFSLVSASSAINNEIAVMTNWLNGNPNAPTSQLYAVVKTNSCQTGQDYLIPGVPDVGSTLILLGVGLVGLVGLCRRFAV